MYMYIITFGSGRGAGGKQHRKSVQEHFINSLPSHSAMLSWNYIMPLPVIVSLILKKIFDINLRKKLPVYIHMYAHAQTHRVWITLMWHPYIEHT